MRSTLLCLAPVSALCVLLTGCEHLGVPEGKFSEVKQPTVGLTSLTLTNRLDPAWLQTPTEPFTLGPGDKLEIEILGEPTSKSTTVVGPDGKIYFNLLPGVDVWGLTLDQARAQIVNGLAKYLKEQPQVSIVLRGVESKQVWILGRVQAPGLYPLATPTTVLEALSLAGGTMSLSSIRQQEATGATDDLADLRRGFVLRHGRRIPVDFQRLLQKGDLSQNVYLQAGDFVYLPTAATKEIYVLGAITEPRAVPYRSGLTVAGAVASGYGTVKGAYLRHVIVVRGSLSSPTVAVVDYKSVIRGEAPDFPLQPGDIVYVPYSPYRYLYHYVQLAVDTFVSSVAINAGTQVVGERQNGGAGVFIPVGTLAPAAPPISPPPIR
jgi:polysaccharide biosynthesis/export protein